MKRFRIVYSITYLTIFCLTDLLVNRLEMAKKLGADEGIQVQRTDNEEMLTKRIEEALGSLPDITIDCSGFENTIKLGLAVRIHLLFCLILD